MSDLAHLIETLESRLPEFRRDMTGDDWAAFARLLAEAAPFFAQAETDPDARLEAIFLLREACIPFAATRSALPAPGGMIPDPKPAPPPSEVVGGLPSAPLTQKNLDIAAWLQRAERLCRQPDQVADEQESSLRPARE